MEIPRCGLKLRGIRWADVGAWTWAALVCVTVIIMFVYQAGLNLIIHQEQPTVFMVNIEPNPSFRLPPLTVCPHPAYDPTKLRSLGLNISGSKDEVMNNYMSLNGISEDLTASELWQEAGWDFGQVIDYMETDRDGLINFEHTDEMPTEWKRSLSPLGPCLTYSPPSGINQIVLFFQDVPKVEVCRFPDENGVLERYRGLESQCKQVGIVCNSSCGLEDLIYHRIMSIESAYLYSHATPLYSDQLDEKEDIFSYSRKLFDGNYVLEEAVLSPDKNIYSHLVDTTLVKGSCSHDQSYSHAQCYQRQHEELVQQEVGCSPLYYQNFHQPSGAVCRTPDIFDKVYQAEYLSSIHCPLKCRRQRFNLEVHNSFEYFFAAVMRATTSDLKREVEVETYPLSKFFSDTGGSLGLFLGVSILTFLDYIVSLVIRFCRDEEKRKKIVGIVRWSFLLLLTMGTVIHCLVILSSFLSQPRLTAVSLRAASPETMTVPLLITRRLAARAIGCQSSETATEECLARCLLELATNDIASVSPFVNLDGLPPCHETGLSVPTPNYVVPSEMLLVSTGENNIAMCSRECGPIQNNSETDNRGFAMKVNYDHYNFDGLQLVCSIGGIIGLYLGYSLFDVFNLGDSLAEQYKTSQIKMYFSKVNNALKVGVVILFIVLALWQLHTFLLYHKMSSSTHKTRRDDRTEQLAITVCRWPPLSLSHLASQLNINISSRLLYKLPKEERLSEVLRVMDTLPGNWSNLDEVWRNAAWNISDVIEGFQAVTDDSKYTTIFCSDSPLCAKLWQPVITPLNRCFSLNASLGGIDIVEMTLLFPQVIEKKGILGNAPQIYITVTAVNETPLMSDMIPKIAYNRIVATPYRVKYHGLGSPEGVTGDYRSCVNQCLSELGTDALNCRLPYDFWRPDLLACEQEDYTTIPKYFKGLEGIGPAWHDLKYSNIFSSIVKKREKCYRKCSHLQEIFTTISVENNFDMYPTVVLKMEAKEDIAVKEEDLHTTSQLLSDIGGLAGSSAGFSLLFLLKDLLPKLIARYNN